MEGEEKLNVGVLLGRTSGAYLLRKRASGWRYGDHMMVGQMLFGIPASVFSSWIVRATSPGLIGCSCSGNPCLQLRKLRKNETKTSCVSLSTLCVLLFFLLNCSHERASQASVSTVAREKPLSGNITTGI